MKKQWAFWVITVAYGAAFMLPVLVAEGTFLDGQIYAVLARNLAEGEGTFWAPHFSVTMQDEWYEHPPLGLNIMAVFYRVFGDGVWVEHLYSLFTAVVCGWLIVLLWRQAAGEDERLRRLGWLPVLLWLMNPQVTWAYSNAMLENTMSIFTLAALGLLLRAARDERRLPPHLPLGAAAIVAAGLTKGSVGLFPLVTLLAHQAATGRPGWRRAGGRTLLLIVFCAALLALVLAIPAARHNLASYYDTQFLRSMSGARGGSDNQLVFLVKLLNTLLPPLLLALLLAAWGWRRAGAGFGLKGPAVTFLLLGLAGSAPLVVSPRQSMFYVLPSFTCYALGLAALAGPAVARLLDGVRDGSRAARFWQALAVVLLLGAMGATAPRIGVVSRSADMVQDVKAVGAYLQDAGALRPGRPGAVGLCPRLRREWGLFANFARYWRVGLDTDLDAADFAVGVDGCAGELEADFVRAPLETRVYHLYVRR